jgi:hypothetical protein
MSPAYIEQVARRLCEIRGIDPDQPTPHGAEPALNGYAPAILLYSPAWTRVVNEVRSRLEMDEALRSFE